MRVKQGLLFFTIFVLLFIFYWLFELQNGWPHNENIFQTIQVIAIIGVVGAFVLSLWRPSRLLLPVPLLIAFVIITIISKSDLNAFIIGANLVIMVSLLLIALILRREDHNFQTPYDRQ
jgi:hypothetical protein